MWWWIDDKQICRDRVLTNQWLPWLGASMIVNDRMTFVIIFRVAEQISGICIFKKRNDRQVDGIGFWIEGSMRWVLLTMKDNLPAGFWQLCILMRVRVRIRAFVSKVHITVEDLNRGKPVSCNSKQIRRKCSPLPYCRKHQLWIWQIWQATLASLQSCWWPSFIWHLSSINNHRPSDEWTSHSYLQSHSFHLHESEGENPILTRNLVYSTVF